MWIRENEGTHFWMMISDELRARGVEQMLFVCIDGLRKLGREHFPQAQVQRCMVDIQRNSLTYVPAKYCKEFCQDTWLIYAAASLSAARGALEKFREKRSEQPSAVRAWTDNLEYVEHLFELPAEIRRMVNTTNMIEGFHSALRKVTHSKAAFPDDGAVFLRAADVMKKRIMPVFNWVLVFGQLALLFPGLIH